ncbi:hypothetical protein V6N12_031883 [Hibiscus sabdariffa]|uniref:Reverse transcriptase zinc-binding domain-containing protein n=1 Tax=Hibiscus sabdariffa TaxID=183260 RepID=A0ABR2BZV9_9ROSI
MINGLLGNALNTISSIWQELKSKRSKILWERLVWHPGHIPKHSVIVWIVILNMLLIRDRFLGFGLEIDGVCVLYESDLEIRDNMFFQCEYLRLV